MGTLSSSSEIKGSGKNKGKEKIHEKRWNWENANMGSNRMLHGGMGWRKLNEVSLETPIRYAAGDSVEKWLNTVLCLDTKSSFHRYNCFLLSHSKILYLWAGHIVMLTFAA